MLQIYLHKDILQYVLNLYLEFYIDVPKLENITNFKFDKKCHLKIKEYFHANGNISTKHTYLDENIIVAEHFFSNGKKYYLENYQYIPNFPDDEYPPKNGKSYHYHENGILASELNYDKEVEQEAQYYYYDNGKKWQELNYKNGELDGIQYTWNCDETQQQINNYKDGKKEGIQYKFDKTEYNKMMITCSDYKDDIQLGSSYKANWL
jgi:antitoxin component YwqK of YwqJK toxin-antitoxin module